MLSIAVLGIIALWGNIDTVGVDQKTHCAKVVWDMHDETLCMLNQFSVFDSSYVLQSQIFMYCYKLQITRQNAIVFIPEYISIMSKILL